MNSDLQNTHKSNGSQHEKVSHRPLNERVLQSAVEAAKDEVRVVDASEKGHTAGHAQPKHQRLSDVNGLYQRVEDRTMRYFLLKPMKASIMAAGAGALLALILESSIKKLVKRLR
jgi:hypothetical protein